MVAQPPTAGSRVAVNGQQVQAILEASKAQASDRAVLVAIAAHVNDDNGVAWPSVDRLAMLTGKSVRAVQDSLRRLVELEELAVEIHGAPTGGARAHRANAYRVTVGGAVDRTTLFSTPGEVDRTSVVQSAAAPGAVERAVRVQPTAPKPRRNHRRNPVDAARVWGQQRISVAPTEDDLLSLLPDDFTDEMRMAAVAGWREVRTLDPASVR